MIDRSLADLVLLLHAAFVVFVAFGGLLVRRLPRLAWLHLPAVAWGVFVEYSGWICPLTPLEIRLRERGGAQGFPGGFIDHYVTALLYPEGLTRGAQIALGTLALSINVLTYGWLLRRRARRRA
jgi:hypothetical protein